MTIIEACTDTNLFGKLFKDASTWRNWMTVLKSIFALEMSEEEKIVFTELSGREHAPEQQCDEVWIAAGRRSGKSRMASMIGTYLAAFVDYRPYVAVGERVTVMLMSGDKKQARTLFRYVLSTLESVPMLKSLILRVDAESIDLSNNVIIEVVTNNFRSLRGYTVAAAILDEVAFWRSEESANPDIEVVNALRPSLATIPHSKLIGISSAYRRSGILYTQWKKHFANNESSTLVIQASSQQLNPTIAASVIVRASEADPQAARSEWYAEFRPDLSALFDLDLIERAIEPGRRERAPVPGMSYHAFTDPSGGAHDSFTLGICHTEHERMILDVCRAHKPPFSPDAVVKEFALLLKSYRCSSVVGDRYSGEWVVEAFRKEGIYYQHSELSKSELYLETLPLFAQGVVDLLDVPALTSELTQLERRTSRSGRDTVDHPPGGRDDLANSCCGALSLMAAQQAQGQAYMVNFLTGERIYSEDERCLRREAAARGIPIEVLRKQYDAVLPPRS